MARKSNRWTRDPEAIRILIALGLEKGDELMVTSFGAYNISARPRIATVLESRDTGHTMCYWEPRAKPLGKDYASMYIERPVVARIEIIGRGKYAGEEWIIAEDNILGWRRPCKSG